MSHDDFDFEPQRGLPAPLPEGERLLWQGSPNWKLLAIRGYHARKAAWYFLALILWRIGMGNAAGHTAAAIALSCLSLFALGAAAVAILSTLAYFSSRSAVYSITNKRILIRHGVAVPMTLNIPFKVIESADLRLFAQQRGDIVLKLFEDQRVGYLVTWPYLRPARITHPQPNLRALENAAAVAEILGDALSAYAGAAPRVDQMEHAPAAPAQASVRAASAA